MTKTAELVQIRGNTFAAKSGTNHWVVMDTAHKVGGSSAGSSPKELLLFSLGGCTSSDVISILMKKKVPLRHYELFMTATEEGDTPKVFTDIHLEYIFYGGNIDPRDIEHAIKLSITKYCGVSAMLSKAVNITHSYKIEP